MASRDVFSKALPNIKLATRFDAEGKEIQVEKREDEEQNLKQQEIYDILVAAGYFRARIKGLSAFDKIVGGMTWCIVACDYDVDVDLLFHENLTIGQKIALTEKIVAVLPKMKCPFLIEPHQIQGLDFISIFPVIQWLVKRSVENRMEKAEKLKIFAIGQFHNHFALKSDVDAKQKYTNASSCVKEVQDIYCPRRKYKRKDVGPDDEKMRVKITLLEYGNKGNDITSGSKPNASATAKGSTESTIGEEIRQMTATNEIDVDQLLKTLYVANENHEVIEFTSAEKQMIIKNFTELKAEMSIDAKQLSERTQINALLATKNVLEKKLQKIQDENRDLNVALNEEKKSLDDVRCDAEKIREEICQFELAQSKADDKEILSKIHSMVTKNEELRQYETKFKEQCRQEAAQMQKEIADSELPTPEEELQETRDLHEKEKERLQSLRLQLAKKNRAIVSIERQLDNIPDRTELSQYQRRFIELYNQVSAKHRETKQYYTLYNTLDDSLQYMTKELSLLNSIYEGYAESMSNTSAKEQFVNRFEIIVDGIQQTKKKVQARLEDEKSKRDHSLSQLSELIEKQRKYAVALKNFKQNCERNERLMKQCKALQAKN